MRWRGISVDLWLLLCVHQIFNHIEKRKNTCCFNTKTLTSAPQSWPAAYSDYQQGETCFWHCCALLVPTSLMPREELMQYVAQVLDITAKSTRSYDLSCSLSLQLYTDADVDVVQIRPLTVHDRCGFDRMLVGWLLTCFCWSGWRTVSICWGSFVRKQVDGGWWNLFSWGHIQGP